MVVHLPNIYYLQCDDHSNLCAEEVDSGEEMWRGGVGTDDGVDDGGQMTMWRSIR